MTEDPSRLLHEGAPDLLPVKMLDNNDNEYNMYWDLDYALHKRGEPIIIPLSESQYIFRGEKEAME
jgi:hypothetical protein